MTPEEESKSGRDAYWRAREAADAAREGSGASDDSAEPDSPPPTPDAEPDTSWSPFSPTVQTSAPQAPAAPAPAGDDFKSRRLAALDEAKRLAYAPIDSGVSGKDMAEAQGRDRAQRSKDAFTEALQAWLQRRPQHFTAPTEADDLAKRQQLGESAALKQRGQQLSVQEQIAKSLTDPKAAPGSGLSAYQQLEIERQKRVDEAKARGAQDKKDAEAGALKNSRVAFTDQLKKLGIDPEHASQKDIDRVIEQNKADASNALAKAQFGENKEQHISSDATVLAKELGDPTAFQTKYDRLMQLKESNGGEIPGLGIAEGVRQQPGVVGTVARAVSPSSGQAIEGRKLMRQLAAEYARALSGAGVSDKERAQLNAAAIDVENDDSRIAMAGLDTLKDMYETKVSVTKAGARPEAVQRIENAPRPAPHPAPPPPAAKRPQGVPVNAQFKNGKWYVPYPDGSGWDEIEVHGG